MASQCSCRFDRVDFRVCVDFGVSFDHEEKIENKRKFSIVFIVWGIVLMLMNEIALHIARQHPCFPETFDNHIRSSLQPICGTLDLIETRWNAVKEYNESKVDFTNVRLVTGGMRDISTSGDGDRRDDLSDQTFMSERLISFEAEACGNFKHRGGSVPTARLDSSIGKSVK